MRIHSRRIERLPPYVFSQVNTRKMELRRKGVGYVRIGLVENEHRIHQAIRNIKRVLF